MKRIACIVLILIVTLFCVPNANATSDDDYYVYFDTTGWKNFKNVYCHIWEVGGNSFFGWQTSKEICNKTANNLYSYDIRNLWQSNYYKNGLEVNKDYCVIFFADKVGSYETMQTYDATFDIDCIGDTLKLTGNTVKNPVDTSKIGYDVVWQNNGDNYGSHLTIASDGDIIGSHLCPHESKAALIGSWLSSYYNNFEVDAAATVVSNAMVRLKHYNTDEIYKYIKGLNGSVNPLIDLVLYKAEYNTCGIISLNKEKTTLYIGDTYKIPITKSGNYKTITYKSKNKKFATVSNAGKIIAKKAGTATIEIKTPYITKKFTVTVKKPYIKLKKNSLLMTVKEKEKLKYKATPKKRYKITWKSSNPKIVKVSSKGVVNAVKQGKAYITVTMKYKGKSYKSKCKVISLKL